MKVSVIIPIYNVETYLEKCIDSIINQTLENIEIILVNDGSTDSSLSIAKKFSQKDKRIFLISQKNAGLSAARNIGLSLAKGEYIFFLDSDDWIEPDTLEILYMNISKSKSDFICFRLQFDNKELNTQTVYGKDFEYENLYNNNILKDALLVKNIPTAVWAKMYNRKFILQNNLKFEYGIVNEDTLFTIQSASCANKVSFVNKIFYHTTEREGSISRSSQERLFLDMVIALDKAKEYLIKKELFDEVEIYFKARYLKSFLYNILQIAQRLNFNNYLRIYKLCMNNSLYKEYNTNTTRRILPIKHRFMLILSKSPFICYLTVKLLNLISIRMH